MEGSSNENQVTLCDALDRILNAGVVAHGDIIITVADVDLLRISLRALIAATDALGEDLHDSLLSPPTQGAVDA